MFRIQDNVPEVYINESRDFQLISRLYDVLFSGTKYDIDSMVNVLDATLIKDSMIQLLCTKVGFFPRFDIDSNVLKYIIASFPYILKYKGSQRGIEFAVNAILKAENNPDAIGQPYITIVKKKTTGSSNQSDYTVYIYTTIQLYNRLALEEVLRYVLPIGCDYQILQYNVVPSVNQHPTKLQNSDNANIIRTTPIRASAIRGSSTQTDNGYDKLLPTTEQTEGYAKSTFIDNTVGSYCTTQIVGSGDDLTGIEETLSNYPISETNEGILVQQKLSQNPITSTQRSKTRARNKKS